MTAHAPYTSASDTPSVSPSLSLLEEIHTDTDTDSSADQHQSLDTSSHTALGGEMPQSTSSSSSGGIESQNTVDKESEEATKASVKTEIIEKIERVVEILKQEIIVLARVTDVETAGGTPVVPAVAVAASVSEEALKPSVLPSASTSAAPVSAAQLVKKQKEELDVESVKQMRTQTTDTSPERAPPGIVVSRNNMNSVNDNINSDVMRGQTNESKSVRSDFTSPYNSQQQVLMWKNWGKDIDWGKMKFQGNSDIYSKAQEDQSKGGSSALRKVKIDSDSRVDSDKKRPYSSSPLTAMPILSSDPIRRDGERERERQRVEAEKEKASTVKAAYKVAAPKEKDNKSKKEKEKTAVVMIVREVPAPVPGAHRYPNRHSQWGVDAVEEREKRAGRGRVDFVTAAAATVLVPPIP
jgi:hypothetical protein